LAVTLAMLVCGCSALGIGTPTSSEVKTTLEPKVSSPTIKRDGTLRVAIVTSAGAPEVIQQSDGTYVGLDVDVAAALGDALGLEVEYVPCEYVTDALSADVDVVMGVSSSDSPKLTTVSHYLESAIGFFAIADEPYVATVDQINAGKVAVQSGSTSAKLLNQTNIVAAQTPVSNLNEGFDDLVGGSVNYVVCSVYPGAYLAAQDSNVSFAGTINVPSSKGVGVLATNTDLVSAVQEAMDSITTNGVVDIIRARWVGDLPVLGADSQVTGVSITSSSDTQDASSEAVDSTSSVEVGGNAVTSIG
jgi:polar amino acid transport system substrate-binding protein